MGLEAEPESLIGQMVAGYQLVESIGTGASSWVYRGKWHADTPRLVEVTGLRAMEYPDEVAIKLFVFFGGTPAERNDVRKRFLAEAAALRLLRHPNIVPIIDSGEDEFSGYTYMILPYMAGGSLARLIATEGPLLLGRVSNILTPIASALDWAHREEALDGRTGFVHRDVKPANILLDSDGKPYLADFSIARILSETNTLHTTIGRLMGTPAYMSPEQFRDTSQVGPASDIYSLGMVIYEMVTGQVAFGSSNWAMLMGQHLFETPPSPREVRPDLPEPAAAVILKALAKEPQDRFSSAQALAQAFTAGLQGVWAGDVESALGPTHREPTLVDFTLPVAQRSPTIGQPPARRSHRTTRMARMALLMCLALVVIIGMVFGTGVVEGLPHGWWATLVAPRPTPTVTLVPTATSIPLTITDIAASISPTIYDGKCQPTMAFKAQATVYSPVGNVGGDVSYQWLSSINTESQVETMTFAPGETAKTISTDVKVNAGLGTGAIQWIMLKVTAPGSVQSPRTTFRLTCRVQIETVSVTLSPQHVPCVGDVTFSASAVIYVDPGPQFTVNYLWQRPDYSLGPSCQSNPTPPYCGSVTIPAGATSRTIYDTHTITAAQLPNWVGTGSDSYYLLFYGTKAVSRFTPIVRDVILDSSAAC